MAVDPHTLKLIAQAVISQITDEEKRQRLIIGIIIAIVIMVFIILIPIFAITSTIDTIKSFFGFGEDGKATDDSYYSLVEMHDTYAPTPQIGELEYNGTFPMPVQNATVTSEFGSRVHPVTGKQSFHTGTDLAGAWHSNITDYTFYAHLARIDVVEGQEVEQGTIIGIQGGDPDRDPNPGYSTGSHLHFEIRMSQNGDFVNPREYLYGEKEV